MSLNKNNPSRTTSIRAHFPIKSFANKDQFIDPSNLEYVFHYYLLENLATGLVRDMNTVPGGYDGILADHWEFPTSRKIVFQLRSNLSWSNGEPITEAHWKRYLSGIKNSPSRHLRLVKLANGTYQSIPNTITFEFNHDITLEAVLHELSLADASLLHPENLRGTWQVTSGPYSVKTYDYDARKLTLSANPQSRLLGNAAPQEVQLFDVEEKEDLASFFKKETIDLTLMRIFHFSEPYRSIIQNAPNHLNGFPVIKHFFKFNPKNPLSTDIKKRQILRKIIQDGLQETAFPEGCEADTQMVPSGYPGRLEVPTKNAPIEASRIPNETSLKIHVDPEIDQIDGLVEKWRDNASKLGVNLDVQVKPYPKKMPDDIFAYIYIFAGNQKDPAGSWQFLYGPPLGPISQFYANVQKDMKHLTSASTKIERDSILHRIHETCLNEVHAVPFMSESPVAGYSDRIDLSNWNRFDMRYRFYEIIVK